MGTVGSSNCDLFEEESMKEIQMDVDSFEELKKKECSAPFSNKMDFFGASNAKNAQIHSVLKDFTWERFSKDPEVYRKRITAVINSQLRQIEATVGLLRYADPELKQLERELGLLNIKCHTYYERFIYNRCLRENANDILSSFDLSTGQSVEDIVSNAPLLLRDSLQLHQIRWRNSVSRTKWQCDLRKANDELAVACQRLERSEAALERRRAHLDLYRKIQAMKEEFVGLSEEETLKKVENVLGMKARPSSKESTPTMRKRSFSEGSLTSPSSISSGDDSPWDEMISRADIVTSTNQNTFKP